MLTFIANYPEDALDARDGMSQRIAAIDSIFKNVPRTYLHISFRRHTRHRVRTQGLVRVESLNFLLHHSSIRRHLRNAQFVYVHSILNAIFIAPYLKYLRDRLILDLHGIVPEEAGFRGEVVRARLLGLTERVAVRNARLLVVVTNAMGDYVRKKYLGATTPSRVLLLPNVEWRADEPGAPRDDPGMLNGIRLIYAGTMGGWQNTDLMLRSLSTVMAFHPNVRAQLYVDPGAATALQKEVNRLGLGDRITSGSLEHERVLEEYTKADAGFVLRNDILLNRVAMPVKLSEYMSYGVIPIVFSPNLGDFVRYGYRYLTFDDLMHLEKLTPAALMEMRKTNYAIMDSICAQTAEARKVLSSFVSGT